jgi:DNA-binding response OmpR family regulator
MVYRVTLELERFHVREAGTLAAARTAIAAERPALVLLDVHLGGGSSDALLEELLVDGVPVVIVSGTAELSEYADRASEVLAKPFDPAELVALVHKHALG